MKFEPTNTSPSQLEQVWAAGSVYIVEMTLFKVLGNDNALSVPLVKELTIIHGDQLQSFTFKAPQNYLLDMRELNQVHNDEQLMGMRYEDGLLPYVLLPVLLLEMLPTDCIAVCKGVEKRRILQSLTSNTRHVCNVESVITDIKNFEQLLSRPSDLGHVGHKYCAKANAKILYRVLVEVFSANSDGASW